MASQHWVWPSRDEDECTGSSLEPSYLLQQGEAMLMSNDVYFRIHGSRAESKELMTITVAGRSSWGSIV